MQTEWDRLAGQAKREEEAFLAWVTREDTPGHQVDVTNLRTPEGVAQVRELMQSSRGIMVVRADPARALSMEERNDELVAALDEMGQPAPRGFEYKEERHKELALLLGEWLDGPFDMLGLAELINGWDVPRPEILEWSSWDDLEITIVT